MITCTITIDSINSVYPKYSTDVLLNTSGFPNKWKNGCNGWHASLVIYITSNSPKTEYK